MTHDATRTLQRANSFPYHSNVRNNILLWEEVEERDWGWARASKPSHSSSATFDGGWTNSLRSNYEVKFYHSSHIIS